MLTPKQNLPADQRQLLKYYANLSDQDRESLVAFAEFLATRTSGSEDDDTILHEPDAIPRPEQESVVAAIKRLSKSYYMLDKSALFTETSSLMTAHLVQGRSAPDVIDELELLFVSHYEKYLSERNSEVK